MKLARFLMAVMTVSLWSSVCMAQQQVVVVLTDGSRLLGTLPAATTFPVQSGAMQVPAAIKRIDSITMADDHKTAEVIMLNGDRSQSAVVMPLLQFTTLLGQVPLDMRLVKTLTVIAAPGNDNMEGLVLSNSLASDTDLAHSALGPAIKPYTDAKNGPNAPGDHEFVLGDHGRAVTLKGTYGNDEFVHNLELDGLDKLINPEEGTIEFWYCQKARPLDNAYGVYRMFDGEAGLGACVGFFAARNTIFFNITCGGQTRGFTCPIAVIHDDQWIHMAVVWNRKGIGGTDDTMGLYINGTKVASSTANDWGTVPGGRADVCGGQNANCAGKYLMSDLKIWKRAVVQVPLPGQAAWKPSAPNTSVPANTPRPASVPAGPTPPPFGRQVP